MLGQARAPAAPGQRLEGDRPALLGVASFGDTVFRKFVAASRFMFSCVSTYEYYYLEYKLLPN